LIRGALKYIGRVVTAKLGWDWSLGHLVSLVRLRFATLPYELFGVSI
jgi:hypothetical protein